MAQLFHSEPKVGTEIKPALLMQEQEPKAIFNTPQRNMSPRWQAGRVERTAEVGTWRKQALLFPGVIQGPNFLPDSVGFLGL